MGRITRDTWMMLIAHVISMRSTCVRRAVGCVITDGSGMILSTGHNGVAPGEPHCNKTTITERGTLQYIHPCEGATGKGDYTKIDSCGAIHAEQNAILRLSDHTRARKIYVTTFPCPSCVKLLLATPIHTIYYTDGYGEAGRVAMNLFTSAGFVSEVMKSRTVVELDPTFINYDLRLLEDHVKGMYDEASSGNG